MFNGLIREVGKVLEFQAQELRIVSRLKANLGDSIAVNGACLSVSALHDNGFSVMVSEETLKHIASENFKGFIHLEPAMKLGDKIDGHLLQGHIDAIGIIRSIKQHDVGVDFLIQMPKNIQHLIVPKGSIGIDGVSLTVNEVFNDSFRLTLIPLTFKESNFCHYHIGRRVNIETDIIVRSLAHIYKQHQLQKKLTWDEVDSIMMRY